MRRYAALIVFGLAVLAQNGLPASMLVRRAETLRDGRVWKFKTAPVDPYDAFRGKYVTLRLAEDRVAPAKGFVPDRGKKVYVLLEEDAEGFAHFSGISHEKTGENDCVQARIRYFNNKEIHLDLPIDRYYMEESKAPEAERVYRQNSRRGEQDAFVAVRILDGFPVIEELYIADTPIREYLEQGAGTQ